MVTTGSGALAGRAVSDEEFETMQRLWREGLTIDAISRLTWYSVGYVKDIIANNRDKFPYRNAHHDDEFAAMVAKNVLSGNMTRKAAAKKFGVHVNTVSRWVKLFKEGGLDAET